MAHALGIVRPNVAVLSATEVVNEKIPSTGDAVALTAWAKAGGVSDAVVDGPLALDLAVSPEAVRIKGFVSPVAGVADILIVPDIVSGNLLVKCMTDLMGACLGGVVVGAKVPNILTSRAYPPASRLASAALAAAMRGAAH